MVSVLPRKSNLTAAVAISEVVRTSLGPHARNKLLVDDKGHVTSSNDGHTVLKGLPVEHPIGELIVQLSSGQDDAIGDGTTSVVVVFGALCSKALYLIDKGMHPSVIIEGYHKACEFALSELPSISQLQHSNKSEGDNISTNQEDKKEKLEKREEEEPSDEILQFLANTALHSKVAEQDRVMLANICIQAIKLIKTDIKRVLKSVRAISVMRIEGGSLEHTRLLNGIVLSGKPFIHPSMPKHFKGGEGKKCIAVLSCSLDVPRPKTQFSLHAHDASRENFDVMRSLAQIYAQETLATLLRLGVKVVFCQWGVDPYLAELLATNGIIAVRWIAGNELEKIAITIGALICPYLPTLTSSMLGSSPRISEVGEEPKFIEIEGLGATIIVRGAETVAESAIISINDALFVLENAYSDQRTVAGGGATEIELYNRVSDFAAKEGTKESYIIKAWAEALLSIPTTLAENASFFAPDIVSQLIAQHRKGMSTQGVGANSGVKEMRKEGILELLKMKHSIISMATESACHIIKIDECILLT